MGWTSLHREKGQSNREFFGELLGPGRRIIDSHTEGRTEFYAAVEDLETGEVWALVVLTRWNRGHWNFTYKEMSETCGPGVDSCPPRLLDRLSPTESEWANEWRARCRSRAERKAANAAALVDGATVKLPSPLRFSDGSERDTFTYRKAGRRTGLYADGVRFRIPGWREWPLEVTPPAAS